MPRMHGPIRVLLLALLVTSGLILAGCTVVRGSGSVKSETRSVHGFRQVAFHGAGNLTIDQTGTESLTIEAEDNILPLLQSDVAGDRLLLGPKEGASIQTNQPINYHLTVKDLDSLSVSGSGQVTASNLQTSNLTIDISGSGGAKLAGTAATQDVTVSGSGSYLGDQLAGKAARVAISGSGSADVNASDTLDVRISGSGSVQYHGNPTVTQHISGSGSLRRA